MKVDTAQATSEIEKLQADTAPSKNPLADPELRPSASHNFSKSTGSTRTSLMYPRFMESGKKGARVKEKLRQLEAEFERRCEERTQQLTAELERTVESLAVC